VSHRFVFIRAVAVFMLTVSAVGAPTITVTGPIEGNPAFNRAQYSLKDVGYVEEEFFFSGTATSYKAAGQPADTAPYASRLVIIRPSDPKKFNGTVVVEWLNVTTGGDSGIDWTYFHRELIRDGFAYAGVSAQKVGIEGGPSLAQGGTALKPSNPERYGKLNHPGDAFSYDIYSQAGRAIRGAGGVKVLGPLALKHVLGAGESQSAVFLTTYVNDIDPLDKVYDGFLIHSRFANGASLAGAMGVGRGPAANVAAPSGVQIRVDVRVPVLTFETETDVIGQSTNFIYARQPDGDRVRIWEVPGTAHVDSYYLNVGAMDSGLAPIEKLAAAWTPGTMGGSLGKPMNSAPQHHYVDEAALYHLNRWVSEGKAPPKAARMETVLDGQPHYVFDKNGNVLGGIRTPWVDVPVARLSASGQTGAGLSFLFGTTQIFDDATLKALYPGGKADYLVKFNKALDAVVKAGFILGADVPEIKALAGAMYPK
jgi:Alpha/beta hydrolase domain